MVASGPRQWKKRKTTPRYPPIDREVKTHDVVLSQGFSATGTYPASLNLIGQGIDEDERIGRQITVVGWNFKYVMTKTSSGNQYDFCRVILFQDTNCNGAMPALASDILESASFTSFRNLTNKNRFKILSDKTHTITNEVSGVGGMYREIHGNTRIPINYSSPTGLIGTVTNNNLGLLLINKNGSSTTLAGNFRLRFVG